MPPPLWHPHIAIMTNYLFSKTFFSKVIPSSGASQLRPVPQRGTVMRVNRPESVEEHSSSIRGARGGSVFLDPEYVRSQKQIF